MHLFIEREHRTVDIEFEGTVEMLLKQFKIIPESVLVACNDELVTEDHIVKNSDTVHILSVISGG